MDMMTTEARDSEALIKKLSILYVDDEDDVRSNMGRYLARRAGAVYVAANGREGLELFQTHRPQLVISDIRMPVMDGIAMGREIRAIDPEVAIVIVSAHNESELLLSSIDLGVAKYLVKPVEVELLMQTITDIAELLEHKRSMQRKLETVNANIGEVEYEAEKVKSYVARYLESGQHEELPNIRHLSIPKGRVSGDFYSVVRHRNDLYVLLADGAGHGLSAVVPALQVPRIFQQQAGRGFSLLAIADEINRVLYEQRFSDHFVAATLVRMNPNDGFVEVLNCGNPPALIVDAEGGLIKECYSNTFSLGMVDSGQFDADIELVKLAGVARVYLFTDGLVDALQAADQKFDYAALRQKLVNSVPAEAFDIVSSLAESAVIREKIDDVTMLEVLVDAATMQVPALPEVEQDALTERYAGEAEALLKQVAMLYVEDDDNTREYLGRHFIRRVGMLYTAGNGKEGLALFKEHRPQIIVSDIKMPVMNGLDMAEEIRKIDRDVPIVLSSGSDNVEDAERMFRMGVTRFQMKPVSVTKLIELIIDCVKQNSLLAGMKLSASVFQTSSLAIIIADREKRIVSINPAFTRITGYTLEEVAGRSPTLFSSGKHDAGYYQAMWQAVSESGTWSGEIWSRHKDGELFLEWLTINTVLDESGNPVDYLFVFSDISARNAAEEKMRHLAQHDSLTQLPNRILFSDRLSQGVLQAERNDEQVALLYVNIDSFKEINNTLGLAVGDELLRVTAQRIIKCVRDTDTVSRLGGDEFAVLLMGDGDRNSAGRVAARIIDAINQPHDVLGKEIQIRASVGISLFPGDGNDAGDLVRYAGSAMHLAQSSGGNNYKFFERELDEKAERRLSLQQGMRNGLRSEEFFMLYQPKYSFGEERVVGAEALIRWQHATLGIISPVEFIPIAEETGFIIELSEWVIDSVCRQLGAWKKQGLPQIPVSINISSLHFQRGNLVQSLDQALRAWGVTPDMLQIEVTESMLMENAETALGLLEHLRKLGFRISIDDFGTGYSSLSYLRNLPLDELKIDRSFITELPEPGQDADIRRTVVPRAIIQLAAELHLTVIAEGVETESQKAFLMENGCDVIQGYLFSRPLTADEFAALLQG